MRDPNHPQPTDADLWEQDRSLLEEYGPSHIDVICQNAVHLRQQGEIAEADELDQQCARMRIILLPDRELLAAWRRSGGEPGNSEADALTAEIECRGLDS